MFHIKSADIRPLLLPCPARIWKVRNEPFSQTLALELRDETHKTVSFALADPVVGRLQPVPGPEPSDWWTGLEDFRQGVLLVHGYEEQSLPMHRGLRAVDAVSGRILWDQPEAVYYGMVAGGVLAELPCQAGRELHCLSMVNGQSLSHHPDPSEAGLLRDMDEYRAHQYAALSHPKAIHPGDPGFAEWTQRLGAPPTGPFRVAGTGDAEVVAWHRGNPRDGFDLALAICRGNATPLEGWLEKGMKGMDPEPFFIHHRRVIAIRERRELVLIDLSQ